MNNWHDGKAVSDYEWQHNWNINIKSETQVPYAFDISSKYQPSSSTVLSTLIVSFHIVDQQIFLLGGIWVKVGSSRTVYYQVQPN